MECKSRKEEEFDSIYRAYADSVLQVVAHYAKDYEVAQDITQMAFFQLYKHFDDVDLETVYPWLIQITKNLMYNYHRDFKREILDEAMEILIKPQNVIRLGESMENYYLRKEQQEKAKELSVSIFDKLYKKNPKWHEVIMLVDCLGKPPQQVAEELGVTNVVLYSRLYRARKWIRKNYEKEYEKVSNWFCL